MSIEEELEKLKTQHQELMEQVKSLSQRLAKIDGPKTGGNTTTGNDVVIGDGTILYSARDTPITIGDNSRIWRDGEWFGPISVGRDVVVGQHSYFRENVTIEDSVFIGPFVRLLTDTREIRDWKSRAGAPSRAPIHIGRGAWIGADVTVLAGVTIGAGSVVKAGSVVDQDVPPNSVVHGVPAQVIETLAPLKLSSEQIAADKAKATAAEEIKEPEFTIVTMSRGDEKRLADWVLYHHNIGFTRFVMMLDNPNDNSEQVLKELAQKNNINIECIVKEPLGDYIDGASPQEFRKWVLEWKKKNEKEIAESPYPVNDPLSWRQYHYIPPFLDELSQSGLQGWVAVIDVDEYIVLEKHQNIADFVAAFDQPRIRFTNYNFDMAGWDGETNPRAFATKRWDIDELAKLDNAWSHRVKSIVRYEAAQGMVSVHGISRGGFSVADSHVARLNHYKIGHQEIGIGYNAVDTTIVPKLS